ncbi:hypothetical protein [Citrobacter phage vB_CfrS_K1M]
MTYEIQRRVVCAANKYELRHDGVDIVFVGVRHFCPLMRQNMEAHKDFIKRESEVQGFVDQLGAFMDRFEALKVATDAGQLNITRIKT